MFIVNLTYVKPLEEVEKHLADHIKFLDKYYASNNFICSGRKNPRVGGIILCNAKNTEEIKEIISEDPFSKNNIANYEIVEFQPTKYVKSFKEFIE
ncbi:YciI family protein [Clostridium sporogenes]|uniref:YciI family protein n=1 Tax=Clostridium sporogenes TaxID=1509 RepID=UPI00024BAEE4|nr:YciI family protein [Clostridium sporogenes]EHN14639.1 YCII-like protein [Clostridium sporogenes PA 3679]MCW6106271.1 YciI family protein [Clostridium sporogenes]MDU4600191.1 YciI family protein [Clostridium sporogenes]NFF67671.1 YciI family protein [Clostridium sporogenes]NFF98407.1 YciI family protein [Clostridium sporogenes]